jgi:hypothetical protein
MAYVTLDAQGNIAGAFARPQPDFPGYAEIADDDARLIAWRAALAAPAVPAIISAMQAKVALSRAGLLASVAAWVSSQAAETQLIWSTAPAFSRGSNLLNAAAAALGLTSAQVDGLFITAAAIDP